MDDKNTNPDSSKKDNLGMPEGVSEAWQLVSQINSFSDSMEQEIKHLKEKHDEFVARFKELHRSGGSDEDVQKVVDDFKARVSEFQENDEKCRVQMKCLMDASKAKLKEIETILEADKSSSDKVAPNPEAFLGEKEHEAMMQRDDSVLLGKRKVDHELAPSHHEGPFEDVSKKWKADADSSDKEEDFQGAEALKQEKYKTVVGEIVKGESIVERLKLKERDNVSQSAQKEVYQSESLGARKEMDQSAEEPESLRSLKEKDQSEYQPEVWVQQRWKSVRMNDQIERRMRTE